MIYNFSIFVSYEENINNIDTRLHYEQYSKCPKPVL